LVIRERHLLGSAVFGHVAELSHEPDIALLAAVRVGREQVAKRRDHRLGVGALVAIVVEQVLRVGQHGEREPRILCIAEPRPARGGCRRSGRRRRHRALQIA